MASNTASLNCGHVTAAAAVGKFNGQGPWQGPWEPRTHLGSGKTARHGVVVGCECAAAQKAFKQKNTASNRTDTQDVRWRRRRSHSRVLLRVRNHVGDHEGLEEGRARLSLHQVSAARRACACTRPVSPPRQGYDVWVGWEEEFYLQSSIFKYTRICVYHIYTHTVYKYICT